MIHPHITISFESTFEIPAVESALYYRIEQLRKLRDQSPYDQTARSYYERQIKTLVTAARRIKTAAYNQEPIFCTLEHDESLPEMTA